MKKISLILSIAVTVACFSSSLAKIPYDIVAYDEVDLIEINHTFDTNGRKYLDQVIFYEWSNKDCRYQVVAWRIFKKHSQFPIKNWASRKYNTVWYDRDTLRSVSSNQIRETWTGYDPELVERDFLPSKQRRELKNTLPIR